MVIIMKSRITLYADEGMILTDGKRFGRTIHLAAGEEDLSAWREITEEEYRAIVKECEEKEVSKV